jgi:anti-sigma factor RsiW
VTTDLVTPGTISPIDCEATVRRLWDYLDGRLTNIAREEVEAHLAICELCALRFDFAKKVQSAIPLAEATLVTDDAEARLRARVREALRRHAAGGSGPSGD